MVASFSFPDELKKLRPVVMRIDKGANLYLFTKGVPNEVAPGVFEQLHRKHMLHEHGVALGTPAYGLAAGVMDTPDTIAALKELGVEIFRDGQEITHEQAKAELHRRNMAFGQSERIK